MNYRILIIGSGNIGLRYVQAIEKINLRIDLYIWDKDESNILKVKKLLKNKRKFNFFSYSEKLSPKKFDLLIISTTSDARVNMLNKYLIKINVKKIILET